MKMALVSSLLLWHGSHAQESGYNDHGNGEHKHNRYDGQDHGGHHGSISPTSVSSSSVCPTFRAPNRTDKARSARWLLHSMEYAVVSTMSQRMDTFPFGNIVSIVDGPCSNSTGKLYLFGSPMDQTFIDIKTNNHVSVTVSQTMLDPNDRNCHPSPSGDPENPMCARLVLTGHLEETTDETSQQVKEWFNERHPAIKTWPADHGWTIVQLHLHDVWFINFFGGATVLDTDTFEGATLELEPTGGSAASNVASMGFFLSGVVSMVLSLMAGLVLGVFGSYWFHESVQYAKIVDLNNANTQVS